MQRGSFAAVLVVTLAAASCGGGELEPAARSAVLITLDTTNPWALDCYGEDHGVTPNLSRLAAESIVFDQARSVAPLTLPAHSSMMTGLVPLRHGVHDNGLVALPQSASTLAERARAAGFQTAAFVSAAVLAEPYGIDQGFDVFDAPAGESAGAAERILERSAGETTARARQWLSLCSSDEPFFLWVHYFDPHAPYEPPAKFRAQAGGDPYLGEVAAMDDALGDLLATLRSRGMFDQATIIVAGDHGDSHGAHGEPTHATFVYDSTIHVPLMVRSPNGSGGARRSDATVSVVDIEPTLRRAMGIEIGDAVVDGKDLLAQLEFDPRRSAYVESYSGYLNYGWSPIAGVVRGGQKYVHSSDPELFDLRADPGEARSVYQAGESDVRAFRAVLEVLSEAPRLAPDASSSIDDEARAALQALGYAGAGDPEAALPGPLEDTGLPAPLHRTGELRAVMLATDAARRGDRDRAIASLNDVVADNPRNAYALDLLGALLFEEKRYAEAIEPLERLVDAGRARVTTHDFLGHAFEALGELDRAREHFRIALDLRPGDPHQLADVERLRE